MGDPLGVLLFLFGLGFLATNLILLTDYLRYRRRRRDALLVWPAPRARTAVALSTAIAAGLGGLLFYKLVILRWPAAHVFGESMMFAYYGYLLPLSWRVQRGFYQDGIWLDRGFARYQQVTGITWHDDPTPTLVVVSGHAKRAGRLTVPAEHYAEARRLLRDRIAAHQLHFQPPLLDLGGHDEREDV
ncbi:MAG: hypothetical protein AABY89_01415 [Acidobacteriota bacterium]